jgi:hypothetical protein
MLPFPAPPAPLADLPEDRRATGTVPLRYEDIAQDGRLVLEALSPALGEVVWRRQLWPDVLRALSEAGIVAILTRLVGEGDEGPFATHRPLESTGTYQFAHTLTPSGTVDRIVLEMWIESQLPIGRNYGPPPPRAGERVRAGRLYAEHVLTRLFAPPEQRKVTRFTMSGAEHHGPVRPWVLAESVATLPEGAVPLEAGLRVDPTPIAFGLAHTDSNQHVNSLVYPRIFEDAANRRFLELGKLAPPVLARRSEAAFRKPCFAGEGYALALQAFTYEGQLGAVGVFVTREEAQSPERLAKAKGHCFVRMLFAPAVT